MVIESELLPFLEWFPGAALTWLIVIVSLSVAALVLGLLAAIVRHGPVTGFRVVGQICRTTVTDLVWTSPRRIFALASLAVKESIRKKVVVGFAVFILVLMLAGWFLDPSSTNPGRLYLSFVMTSTSYMVLLLALFLSAFSLPADIRSRTLHTVVTKPVRASEIVLGRILGFTAVGTVLLVVMGVLSYLFVDRGLAHTHTLSQADLRPVSQAEEEEGEEKEAVPLTGETSLVHGHRHEVYIDPSGTASTRPERGHTHELVVEGSGEQAKYKLGSPKGILVARVPVYGKLGFRDHLGFDKKEGINVGDEWTYRSYVQGGTPAAAIWTFQGIRKEEFPEGLPVEMTLGVFRTHKGIITRKVLGSLAVRNPKTGLTVETEIFESEEFITKELFIPRQIVKFSNRQMISRKVETPQGAVESNPPVERIDQSLKAKAEFDLFEDLAADGTVEIWLQCLESGQHFGAAQPDLYLRAVDASVKLNFVKGYFGIWLQMVLVTSIGVMFSTFLSGAVAMIATLGSLVGGFFSDFMSRLARGEVLGGGPVEAFNRLITQQNVMTELDPGLGTNVMQMLDRVLQLGLHVISSILPPFSDFSYANYVANGFNIPADAVLVGVTRALACLVPFFVVGYLFLRNREVAR